MCVFECALCVVEEPEGSRKLKGTENGSKDALAVDFNAKFQDWDEELLEREEKVMQVEKVSCKF